MKPIIVATDFSPASQNAAKYATDMACVIQSDIILVHVFEVPATALQVPLSETEFNTLEEYAKANLADLKKYLDAITNGKINISTELLYGTVQTELEKFAQSKFPFAIVTGSKSQSNFERFLLGSNTLRLVHHQYYPLLIVPENLTFKGIRNIAIASDLTDTSDNPSFGFIKKWLNAFKVSPDILHLFPSGKTKYDTAPGIAFLKNNLGAFNPSFHFIENTGTETVINNFLRSHNTDLLIVMPGKHSFFESMMNRSFSNEMMIHASLPVLSILHDTHNSSYEAGIKHRHGGHSCKNCDGSCKGKSEMKKLIDEAHTAI